MLFVDDRIRVDRLILVHEQIKYQIIEYEQLWALVDLGLFLYFLFQVVKSMILLLLLLLLLF